MIQKLFDANNLNFRSHILGNASSSQECPRYYQAVFLALYELIINENMQNLGLKQDFIDNILQKQQTKNLKDVLILTINSNGEVYYQEKNKQSQVLNVEVNI